MSFPPGTEMFQFPGFASLVLYIQTKITRPISDANMTVCKQTIAKASELVKLGFPIQKSRGQRLFAPYPGLSQRTTSFIASVRQGIH